MVIGIDRFRVAWNDDVSFLSGVGCVVMILGSSDQNVWRAVGYREKGRSGKVYECYWGVKRMISPRLERSGSRDEQLFVGGRERQQARLIGFAGGANRGYSA